MSESREARSRMIFSVPPEIQMAVKLQAVKSGRTTGEVVAEAVQRTYPDELKEARSL